MVFNTNSDCKLIIMIKYNITIYATLITLNKIQVMITSMIWVDVISISIINNTIYMAICLILKKKIIKLVMRLFISNTFISIDMSFICILCTSYFISLLLSFIIHTLFNEFDFMGYEFVQVLNDIISMITAKEIA